MNFLKKLSLIVSILPTLIDAVKAVEEKITEQGAGAEKLGLVRTILESVWDATVSIEQIWPSIKTVIDAVVGIFNRLGIFGKTAPEG